MKKLTVLVTVLALGFVISASAVQLDGYHVLDEQKVTEGGDVVKDDEGNPVTYTVYKPDTDEYVEKQETEGGEVVTDANGDPVTEKVVQKRLKDTDTSNFTTLEDYNNLIANHIAVDGDTGSSYAVCNLDHPNRGVNPLQSILDEAIERDIAEPHEILKWLAVNVGGTVRLLSGRSVTFDSMGQMDTTVKNIAAVDTSKISELDTSMDSLNPWTYCKIASAILTQSDSDSARQAFDNIWAVVDKTVDTASVSYRRNIVVNYHLPLGNFQQAYDLSLELVNNGIWQSLVLNKAVNTDMPATEELLWAIVQSVDSEWYTSDRVSLMVDYWKNAMDWTQYLSSPQEAIDICDKYRIAVDTNDTTRPFIVTVKEKKQAFEDAK